MLLIKRWNYLKVTEVQRQSIRDQKKMKISYFFYFLFYFSFLIYTGKRATLSAVYKYLTIFILHFMLTLF